MMHHPARVARLLTVAVLLGVVGGSSWSSPAAACSCGLTTTRNVVGRAPAIVSGEPVERWSESVDGWDYNVWAFEVDERWVGDTPDVVEVQATATETSCGPPIELDASILLLGWRASNGRFEVSSGCFPHTLERAQVERLFGTPELFPDGEPVAIVSADAGGHASRLVDAEGRSVRYLPGDGETHGLAPCPGGEHFLQLRGGPGDGNGMVRSFELAIWRYDGWIEVAVHPVDSPQAIETSETLVCRRPDGGDALIVWSAYVGATSLVDGDVTAVELPVDVPGPDGAAFRFNRDRSPQVVGDAEAFDVTWAVGGGYTRTIQGDNLMSILPDTEGWDLTVDDWTDAPGESSQAGIRMIRLGVDGQATSSSDLVPLSSLGWGTGMLIPPERRTTTGLPAFVPPPLFDRSGRSVETPPTVPTAASSVDPTAPIVESTTEPPPAGAGSTDPDPDPLGDADDGTRARSIAGGVLLLVVVGGVLLVVRRSGDGRGGSPP